MSDAKNESAAANPKQVSSEQNDDDYSYQDSYYPLPFGSVYRDLHPILPADYRNVGDD
jgi:hypothetical protein